MHAGQAWPETSVQVEFAPVEVEALRVVVENRATEWSEEYQAERPVTIRFDEITVY